MEKLINVKHYTRPIFSRECKRLTLSTKEDLYSWKLDSTATTSPVQLIDVIMQVGALANIAHADTVTGLSLT